MGRTAKAARNAWKAPFAALALFGSLALGASLALPSDASANKVGVAAAVKPDAFSGGKQIKIGKSIFYNERINTNGEGLVQVLLVDGSTFTVGPGSDLVIDKFVYDPSKNEGEIAASFSKGVVRFVGGKISKSPDSVTVKTPSGALAIRGGMFQGSINSQGAIFSFLYGDQLVLTGSNGQTYRVFQPGYTLDLTGGTPRVRPTTAADTNMIMDSLRGSGRAVAGGTGGGNGTGGDGTGGNSGNSQNQQTRDNSIDPFESIETIITDATTTIINQQIQNQENTANPKPNPNPNPTPEPTEPTKTAVYTGFAGGTIYSDTPAGFINSVGSPEDGGFNFNLVQYSDGSATSRMILHDAPYRDPVVTKYDFSFASDNGVNFTPTLTVYDSDYLPYPNSFAATNFRESGPEGFCQQCSFMKWGAVTGAMGFGSGQGGYSDYMATTAPTYWVASNKLTSPVQIDNLEAQNANARYAGDVLGSVLESNGQNVTRSTHETGSFTLDWYFADRSGDMNMYFDGRHFGGELDQVGSQNLFTGALSNRGQLGNPSGFASGAFVNHNGPAGAVIGNWAIKDTNNYQAGGIFAGPGIGPVPQ
ncbi:FecR family protein [Methyloligella solikamskensis]|uniref:FecR domain-containing protein n=1 Tax=Methyloligella solikamskensis TaxID=1177756 RepID=A0ABW3JA50_9HYPH